MSVVLVGQEPADPSHEAAVGRVFPVRVGVGLRIGQESRFAKYCYRGMVISDLRSVMGEQGFSLPWQRGTHEFD